MGGVLRGRDWDETSDFGQILRELRIGTDASFLNFRAGPLESVTVTWIAKRPVGEVAESAREDRH